uniref:Uncharacterized protein n=1 Tax=Graphocephala atropunctata TaxID=36148 RepID=A0A1B6LI97_9HEMI
MRKCCLLLLLLGLLSPSITQEQLTNVSIAGDQELSDVKYLPLNPVSSTVRVIRVEKFDTAKKHSGCFSTLNGKNWCFKVYCSDAGIRYDINRSWKTLESVELKKEHFSKAKCVHLPLEEDQKACFLWKNETWTGDNFSGCLHAHVNHTSQLFPDSSATVCMELDCQDHKNT